MLITINGQELEVPDHLTLDGLINHLALAPERLAVELNREVVRRVNWPHTALTEGDRVEIVHFVGGGASQALNCYFQQTTCPSSL